MADKLKEALHKVELHVDTAVSKFTTPNPSMALYDEMRKRCDDSLKDYDNALLVISSLHTKKTLRPDAKDRLLTMSFFLEKMKEDTSARIFDALRLRNSTLALASFNIIKHNWAEVKGAYHEFLELTEER